MGNAPFGTKVICVDPSHTSTLAKDAIYTILGYSRSREYVEVANDKGLRVAGNKRTDRFRLYDPPKAPNAEPGKVPEMWVIIVMDESGDLKPAPTPRTYASAEQARSVAYKLAEKAPNLKFFTFKAEGFACHVPTTVWCGPK